METAIILLYVVVFWVLLPFALYVSSRLLDAALGLPLLSGLRVVGYVLAAASLPLLLLSIRRYVKTTGRLPVSAYPPGRIIRSGIYSVWRHPIYLFFTALLYGAAMAWGSPAMVLIVMPAFVILELAYIAVEERFLVRRFGGDYLAHMEMTRQVLPGLHHWRRLLFGLLSRFCFPIRVLHAENIPERAPFFVAASHRSYLDPFIIEYCLPYRLHYLATFEVFRGRLSRFVFSSLFGCIPQKRYRPDPGAMRRLRSTLERGGAIGIFPEGERSFTGEMLELKAPVARLFRRHADVPVLPVALSGNYFLWPRWGRGLRRCPLCLEFKPLLRFDAGQDDGQVLAAVAAAIRPDDSGLACRGRGLARDIGLILYRCPACRAFDRLAAQGDGFRCGACGGFFSIDGRYRIQRPDGGARTVDEFYRDIRIGASDVGAERVASAAAEISREDGCRLVWQFHGHLALFQDRLALEPGAGGGAAATIPLPQLRAAVIEKADRLQIYDGRDLFQVVFHCESARKWQDLVAAMAEKRCGRAPRLS